MLNLKKNFFYLSFFIVFFSLITYLNHVKAEEESLAKVFEKIEIIQKDLKTLEKAVYSSYDGDSNELTYNNEDVLTRHLLKLSELEEQFQVLTNKFEEISFKIDKLSNRISKTQSDNQLRFQDLEKGTDQNTTSLDKREKRLPGSDLPQDLASISDAEIKATTKQTQQTQSIDTTGTVITEDFEQVQKILPDKSIEEQYKFAISFLKIGDYDTAELALREFVDTHADDDLAGNAQYWYGETFRIRQLYQDAATAYLDGYQKYPKSVKAPINLLKLGVTLVQIGEKEQGCLMIVGVSDQYPKAEQSILQKAKYEEKKLECKNKKS